MNAIVFYIVRRVPVIGIFFLFCSLGWDSHSRNGPTDPQYYSASDFNILRKFDTHIHLNTLQPAFLDQARADGFHFLDIVDDRPFGITRKEQEKIALQQTAAHPKEVFYAGTFSVRNWLDPDWTAQAIAEVKQALRDGAVAIKVWKNVGMEQKDKDGKFIMISNPRFDSLLNFLADNKIPLIGHLGEPKDCWLPLDKMVLHKGYYSQHPEYHMYLHPEYPSYEDHINARDQMLAKHPNLRFIGAHLGSLEWSLPELAKRLDKYPNLAVDLSRMPEIFLHTKNNRNAVRNFFIRYQDRLLYATDVQVATSTDTASMNRNMHQNRLRNWKFFTSEDAIEDRSIGSFKGLQLPRTVVDKIYRINAEKWLPGILKKTAGNS